MSRSGSRAASLKRTLLRRTLGAGDKNYLSPLTIFSLNRVLQEILDEEDILPPHLASVSEEGTTRAWVVPYLFDHHKRTWHFAGALPEVWDERDPLFKDAFNRVLWLLAQIATGGRLEGVFSSARSALLLGKAYEDAYNKVCDYAKRLTKHIETCSECNLLNRSPATAVESEAEKAFLGSGCLGAISDLFRGREGEVVRNVALLYHSIRVHRGAFLPGIMYQHLCRVGVLGYILDRFEGQTDTNDPFVVRNSIFFDFFEAEETIPYHHQKEFDPASATPRGSSSLALPPCVCKRLMDLPMELAKPIYFSKVASSQDAGLPFVVLPIHDVWLAGRGYGGLWGALLCTFPDTRSREKFVKGKFKEFRAYCEVLAAELTMSALATIANLSIEPPYDLIEHFVRAIIHMQDWECVSVFRETPNGKHDLQYRYRRFLEGDNLESVLPNNDEHRYSDDFEWKRCRCSSSMGPCAYCKSDSRAIELSLEDTPCRHLLWHKDKRQVSFWDGEGRELIPELLDEEAAQLQGLIVEFEYPTTAAIPPKSDGGDTYGLFKALIVNQQIEVLRTLIPKVRARRAALRNAVSAIMGRNLSHNIGSHVISRYIGKVGKHDGTNIPSDGIDPLGSFFGYLQRRMDFLAEIATSDKAHWEQPLHLHTAINALNYDHQDLLIKGKSTNPSIDEASPILLSHITGKDSLRATVLYSGGCEDKARYFSCPGGEVGVHAIYVILENILRNSARHNDFNGAEAMLTLTLDTCEVGEDLIEVTVADEKSKLGRPSDKENLVDRINMLFDFQKLGDKTESGFLSEDNALVTKNMGLREVQICANYLRGQALGDLENPQSLTYPAVRAVAKRLSGGDQCLAFRFYIKSAKILAYVGKPPAQGTAAIRKIDNISGIPSIKDWKSIARESDGYSFLWLPPEFMEAFNNLTPDLKLQLPQRVVFGIDHELCAILEAQADSTDLSWTALLHHKTLDRYRSNGEEKTTLWAGRTVEVVAFPDTRSRLGEALSRVVADANDSDITLTCATVGPISFGTPKGLEDNKNPQIPVKLGFLDHPSDNQLWGSLNPFGLLPDQQNMRARAACLQTQGINPEFVNWASLEPVWSNSVHEDALLGYAERWRLLELAAAAFARVVVLDERIQAARKQTVREVTLWKYWCMAGIWVPFHLKDKSGDNRWMFHDPELSCDLDVANFHAIHSFLHSPTLLDRQCPADFLVIHLTILERLKRELGWDDVRTLEELVKGTKVENASVVVVTGRGVPSVAKDRDSKRLPARHLPLSTLQEHLSVRPSKLGLMRALWAASVPKGDIQ